VGDLIDVTTGDAQARYQVQSTVIVAPDTLDVLESGDGNTLTLITCYPFAFFGAAPDRFVVKARELRRWH
jgi:sortase A